MSAPKVACGPLPEVVDLKVTCKISDSGDKVYTVVHEPNLWPNNSTVTVAFHDGTGAQRGLVKDAFSTYSTYANLNFVYVEGQSADVRVTFAQPGTWSAIGDQALKLEGQPSLSLGAIDPNSPGEVDRSIALHEVGHILGLEHEWDAKATQLADSDDPAISQHAKQYSGRSVSNFPELDSKSVMTYFVPPGGTKDGKGVVPNSQLSDADKAWLTINYPGRGAVRDGVTWNKLQALHTLNIPPGIGAQILGSNDATEQRAHYADFIAREWEKPTSLSEEAQDAIKSEISSQKTRGSLVESSRGRARDLLRTSALFQKPDEEEIPDEQQEANDVSNMIASVLLHPEFRSTVTRIAEADLVNHSVKIENYPIKNPMPNGDVQQGIFGILGTILPMVTQVVGSMMNGIPVQQNGIIQQGISPFQGIQPGQALPLEVQQGIFDVFTKVLTNPIFTNVVKGVVSAVA